MIQVNLLPDVKATYVNAQRTKRTVITLSVIISAVAIGIVLLLASTAYGVQQINLNNVQSDIDAKVASVKSQENLEDILTVQNQLIGVNPLHEEKPVVTRAFSYIQQTTPKDVSMDTYSINFADNSMTIRGTAPNLEVINKYVDTLKFTVIVQPELAEGEEPRTAFSDVVLTSFGTSSEDATYNIALIFEEDLFSSQSEDIKIAVPKIITTRSEIEAPGALFKQISEPQEDN